MQRPTWGTSAPFTSGSYRWSQQQQVRRGGSRRPRGASSGRPAVGFRGFQSFASSTGLLPIPPRALDDPWEALHPKYGGIQPLDVPTEEVQRELQAEVARQVRLQRILGVRENLLGNGFDGAGTVQAQATCLPQPSGSPLERVGVPEELKYLATAQEKQQSDPNDIEGCKRPSEPPSIPPQDLHNMEATSLVARTRPLVLPPPQFGPKDAEEGAAASPVSSTNFLVGTGNDGHSSLAGRRTDEPKRGLRLPAVMMNLAGDLQGSQALCLDEEGILKKLRRHV
ncbi:hypothetical protein, conserved [Eimeria tenella]|uniref:Uncharacterized protein n=1 Tax=Eimeria tenella TaxID=5802 RepID=U6KNI9_EIMTE|nr:hypothetical protein, conserved [Eimeria tenella]CDJ38376.1 hypothetical protein, conserved [Eimeria tenella]|eukprot:XP_013229214.1 hypothetical protein, conserved [Eimeria tenella]